MHVWKTITTYDSYRLCFRKNGQLRKLKPRPIINNNKYILIKCIYGVVFLNGLKSLILTATRFTEIRLNSWATYFHSSRKSLSFLAHIKKTIDPTQRNRYPETGCNGTPSLSNMTDFYGNVTETLCDGARVCAMVIDERHSTVPST